MAGTKHTFLELYIWGLWYRILVTACGHSDFLHIKVYISNGTSNTGRLSYCCVETKFLLHVEAALIMSPNLSLPQSRFPNLCDSIYLDTLYSLRKYWWEKIIWSILHVCHWHNINAILPVAVYNSEDLMRQNLQRRDLVVPRCLKWRGTDAE